MGLPPLDRALLEAIFSRNSQRGANYALVRVLDQADLIISNADDMHAVRALQARRLRAPVVLIGDSDAGTGWPVLARPIQLHAVMETVSVLAPCAPAASARAPVAEAGCADAGRDWAASPSTPPAFAATEPFAPLGHCGDADAPAPNSFEATRPFERSASGATPLQRGAARPGVDDPIDARTVLLWRDALAAAPAPSGQGLTRPASGFPAMAGFEPTRDAVAVERATVPANWQARARQQALERFPPPQSPDAEEDEPSSSFVDPSESLTAPQRLARPGSMPAVLLVIRPRAREGSLLKALRDFGHPVDCAPDGATALTYLAQQDYRFVFLDDRSLGDETLAVCRALRQRLRALGQRPQIVVVARGGHWLRRLFARLAGCDRWMVTPLRKRSLRTYLLENGSGRAA